MTIHKLYNGDVELKFEEGRHIYTVAGKKVVSVTGVTGIIDKSGPLMWWAVGECLDFVTTNFCFDVDRRNKEMDEVELKEFLHGAHRAHQRQSQKAKDIGTLSHEWIESYLNNEDPSPPRNPAMRSTTESWLQWAESVDIEPIETEFKVYSQEHGYAGTCDFDGYVNRERCLADWKTGKAVYPEHDLQTMAYQIAREEELGIEYASRWVIVLPKEGGEIVTQRYGPEESERATKGFLGALDLYHAIKKQ